MFVVFPFDFPQRLVFVALELWGESQICFSHPIRKADINSAEFTVVAYPFHAHQQEHFKALPLLE